jgi:DNA end-binding protein Ku
MDSVPLKTVRAIEIEMFVDARREGQGIEFVKQAYYLEPDPIGRKAFELLRQVLAESDKTAICKIVLKDREQLAALNPYTKTMLLTTLHWPDEVRSLDELNIPEEPIEVKPGERKMAEQLVASMTGEFSAEDYHDEYRAALMAMIEAKVGGESPAPVKHAEPTKIGDLMAALEQSVAAARDARREAAAKPSAAAAKHKETAAKPRTAAKKTAPAEPARRRKSA